MNVKKTIWSEGAKYGPIRKEQYGPVYYGQENYGPIYDKGLVNQNNLFIGNSNPKYDPKLAGQYTGPVYNAEVAGGPTISKSGLRKSEGLKSNFLKSFYPEAYKKRSDSILNKKFGELGSRKTLFESFQEAGRMGLSDVTDSMRGIHSDLMKTGAYKFSPSIGTSIMLNVDNSVRKTAAKAAMSSYSVANSVSKATMGASIPKIALGVGAIAGLGYTAVSSVSKDPAGTISKAYKENRESLRQSYRGNYGHTELGQSVNGLVFGMHNKRHG
jgi:hypothetical protein